MGGAASMNLCRFLFLSTFIVGSMLSAARAAQAACPPMEGRYFVHLTSRPESLLFRVRQESCNYVFLDTWVIDQNGKKQNGVVVTFIADGVRRRLYEDVEGGFKYSSSSFVQKGRAKFKGIWFDTEAQFQIDGNSNLEIQVKAKKWGFPIKKLKIVAFRQADTENSIMASMVEGDEELFPVALPATEDL